MDLTTLSIVLAMVYFISFVIMIFLKMINPKEKGLLTFVIATLLAMVGFVFLFAPNQILNIHITFHVFTTLTASLLLFIGILQFRGFVKEIDWGTLTLILMVFLILSFYVSDKPTLRNIIRDSVMILISLLSAYFIFIKSKGKEKWIHLFIAIGFMLIVPFFLFRWYLAVSGSLDLIFVGISSESITRYIFLIAIPWTIIYTFGFGLSINYRVTRRLKKQTYHDYLTGLRNRRSLDETFNHYIKSSKHHDVSFDVVMIDLNAFKSINDQYGHSVGDQVLAYVADCLHHHLTELDSAYRLGGDEFAVIIHKDSSLNVQLFKEKLTDLLSRGYKTHHYDIPIEYSIGTASFPNEGQSIDELIKVADHNMYAHKKEFRHN